MSHDDDEAQPMWGRRVGSYRIKVSRRIHQTDIATSVQPAARKPVRRSVRS
ncbi:hypothetical protein BMF94_6906 [Rhodotorula taiwanensis]|uniref:Uncharacterized protein n=1 Tax=Rhodotorula taiwanensis TaxID=741276 RepID=A0A2S5B0A4_9BASI|nr:hypothetical protein BMF94_6906 [Rhodotorula taiwanensis]